MSTAHETFAVLLRRYCADRDDPPLTCHRSASPRPWASATTRSLDDLLLVYDDETEGRSFTASASPRAGAGSVACDGLWQPFEP